VVPLTASLTEMTTAGWWPECPPADYPAAPEPVGQVDELGTSRSAVSRRFAARTSQALEELLPRDDRGLSDGRIWRPQSSAILSFPCPQHDAGRLPSKNVNATDEDVVGFIKRMMSPSQDMSAGVPLDRSLCPGDLLMRTARTYTHAVRHVSDLGLLGSAMS
jgi:hypothetical protein